MDVIITKEIINKKDAVNILGKALSVLDETYGEDQWCGGHLTVSLAKCEGITPHISHQENDKKS